VTDYTPLFCVALAVACSVVAACAIFFGGEGHGS